MGFLGGASGKELACQCRSCKTRVRSLGREDPLQEGKAAHSCILAWRILWTEEPGGLQAVGWRSQTRLKRQHAAHPHPQMKEENRSSFLLSFLFRQGYLLENISGGFPGDAVVKTLRFYYSGSGSIPIREN